MKLAICVLLLCGMAVGQSLPDAPAPQPQQAKFWTFRTSWKTPPLRTNKKTWAIFLGSHAVAWTALALANHQQEHWDSEAPAMGAVTGMDFLLLKFFSPAMSFEAAAYGAQHYFRAR